MLSVDNSKKLSTKDVFVRELNNYLTSMYNVRDSRFLSSEYTDFLDDVFAKQKSSLCGFILYEEKILNSFSNSVGVLGKMPFISANDFIKNIDIYSKNYQGVDSELSNKGSDFNLELLIDGEKYETVSRFDNKFSSYEFSLIPLFGCQNINLGNRRVN